MDPRVYLNGKFIPLKKATVSISDYGYLYGDGVFETLRAYDEYVFKLEEHLKRLYDSASTILIRIPLKIDEMEYQIYQTLKKNQLKESIIRITISRGTSKERFKPAQCKNPTVSIIAQKIKESPIKWQKKGVAVGTLTLNEGISKNTHPRIKSCNFQKNVLAKILMSHQNLFEGIFINDQDHIVEGITSNIFIVKNGQLITPALQIGCLGGITRKTVLEIASNPLRLTTQEKIIKKGDLLKAEECFLTNSSFELVPIIQVDKRDIGKKQPGPITRILQKEYKSLILKEKNHFKKKLSSK